MTLESATSFFVELGKDILGIGYLILYGIYVFVAAPFQVLFPGKLKSLEKEIILIVGSIRSNLFIEICRELGKTNATLVVWYDDAGGLQDHDGFLDNLRNKKGVQVFAYEVNLCSRNCIEAAAKRIREEVGDVTIILNASDIAPSAKFLDQSQLEIEKTIESNLMSQFFLTREFLPKMIEMNHGHFVTISTPAISWGSSNFVPFIGSKCGLQGLVESLKDEVKNHMGNPDIKFTIAFPNLLRTNIFEGQYTIRYPSLFPNLNDEYVAKCIVEGFRRNKDNVYVPTSFGFLLWLECMVPTTFIKKLQSHFFVKLEKEVRHA